MLPLRVAILFSWLFCHAAVVQIVATGSGSDPSNALACFYEQRAKTQGRLDDRFVNVLEAAQGASKRFPSNPRVFESELEMANWLAKRQFMFADCPSVTRMNALKAGNLCQRLWFGWSDNTVAFMDSVMSSRYVAGSFPLMITVNRRGWALMSVNENWSEREKHLKCAVNPDFKEHWWQSQFPARLTERLGAKGIATIAHDTPRYLASINVELADWAGAFWAPIGSRVNDATRARILAALLASSQARALTLSWRPYKRAKLATHGHTINAVIDTLRFRPYGIKYLAIVELHSKPVARQGDTLLWALYRQRRQTPSEWWPGLREFSVTLRPGARGWSKVPIWDTYVGQLPNVVRKMPHLRHLNMHIGAAIGPIRWDYSRILGGKVDTTSLSITTRNAFMGVTPARHLEHGSKGRAMLVSVPWLDMNMPAGPGEPPAVGYRVDLALLDKSLLEDTVALTLFVKNDNFGSAQHYQLGMEIDTRLPAIERLAIDGWWSRTNVNGIVLQMMPKLPPSLRYLLVRPVSLWHDDTGPATMSMIAGMLIDSYVQVFALTLELPCSGIDHWPADEYADQLVHALSRMKDLERLELTLSTCEAIEGSRGFQIFSTRVQRALNPDTVTVTRVTWPFHWDRDGGCFSNQTFSPFDAFSSELSENLKLVARCDRPDLRFPMPHHFSGAFDRRFY